MQQLLIHGFADFFFGQASYQAINKSKRTAPALLHVLLYTVCFLIDRYSIPKYLLFAREWMLNPKSWRATWANSNHTGFFDHIGDEWGEANKDKMRPPFLTWWLCIFVDNLMHLGINFLALKYLA